MLPNLYNYSCVKNYVVQHCPEDLADKRRYVPSRAPPLEYMTSRSTRSVGRTARSNGLLAPPRRAALITNKYLRIAVKQ